jgi:dimethylaniline monooxygenase (N-oxide forming)
LYKHCILVNQPTLGFIGLPFVVCNNQMFDQQAGFLIKFVTGQKLLPTQSNFNVEMDERWKRGVVERKVHIIGFDIRKSILRN